MCKAARIGLVNDHYIAGMYHTRGYMEAVRLQAMCSMEGAIIECKQEKGNPEWVICDARHDSTCNAYHTTVPCLMGTTHRIAAVQTLSRETHRVAQTREVDATLLVLEQAKDRGLDINEVAHDMNVSLTKKIIELGYMNSYDTWHGTKGVAKAMKSIASGPKRDVGNKWFTQLSDKCASTKRHTYWAMANCGGSAERLKELLLNIVEHYQNNHTDCHESSLCRRHGHSPDKEVISDPRTAQVFLEKIKSLAVYRHAESYARCRDTYWVESFNHALLTYLPKRIHFGDMTYDMRMHFAVMDWNVEREVTSEKLVVDMRRPNRRTPMKSRKAKTDCFRWAVWRRWCTENMVGARGENLDTHVAEDAPVCGNVAEDSPLAEIFHENPLINDEDDE